MVPKQSPPDPTGRLTYIWVFISYYLSYVVLLPIAYAFNRSFLILHPDQVVPTFIAPPYNHNIRTFSVPSFEIEHIHTQKPQLLRPTDREWFAPCSVPDYISAFTRALESVIMLETDRHKKVELVDGLISQGMGIVQEGHFLYIWEEIGRWPTRHDQVATLTYSWDFNQFLILFIPTSYLKDIQDAEFGWVEWRWGHTLTVEDMINELSRANPLDRCRTKVKFHVSLSTTWPR